MNFHNKTVRLRPRIREVLIGLFAGLTVAFALVLGFSITPKPTKIDAPFSHEVVARLGANGLSERGEYYSTFEMVRSANLVTVAFQGKILAVIGSTDVRKTWGYMELREAILSWYGARCSLMCYDSGTMYRVIAAFDWADFQPVLLNLAPDLPLVDPFGSTPEPTKEHLEVFAPWDKAMAETVVRHSQDPKTAEMADDLGRSYTVLKWRLSYLTPAQAKTILMALIPLDKKGRYRVDPPLEAERLEEGSYFDRVPDAEEALESPR